jgi:hypothetical protein
MRMGGGRDLRKDAEGRRSRDYREKVGQYPTSNLSSYWSGFGYVTVSYTQELSIFS